MTPLNFNKQITSPIALVRFYTFPDNTGHRHMDYMCRHRMIELLVQCMELIENDNQTWKRANEALNELKNEY